MTHGQADVEVPPFIVRHAQNLGGTDPHVLSPALDRLFSKGLVSADSGSESLGYILATVSLQSIPILCPMFERTYTHSETQLPLRDGPSMDLSRLQLYWPFK